MENKEDLETKGYTDFLDYLCYFGYAPGPFRIPKNLRTSKEYIKGWKRAEAEWKGE